MAETLDFMAIKKEFIDMCNSCLRIIEFAKQAAQDKDVKTADNIQDISAGMIKSLKQECKII